MRPTHRRHARLLAGLPSVAILIALTACGDDTASSGGAGGAGASTGSSTSGTGSSASSGAGGAEPVACGEPEAHQGEGTYYDFADGSGNCSFPATPNDLLVAAMNHTDYAGSAACGACIRATGPSGEVTVRIVDRCPECPEGDVDFSPQAFERIAPLSAGRVPITWEWAPCQVEGPLRYHFKDGSSQYWTAIQVRNHRHRVASLAFRTGGGEWVDVPRLEYNYFVYSAGMGEGPIELRVTDVHGGVVEDGGIAIGDDTEVSGAAQLPVCGG